MQKWDVSSELTDQMETAGLEIQPDTLSLKMRKIFGLVLRLLLFSDPEKNYSHDFKTFSNFHYMYILAGLDLLKSGFVIEA